MTDLVQDDTTEEGAVGSPIPGAGQLWIASGWRQVGLCPQGNRHRSRCLANASRKDLLDTLLRLTNLAPIREWGKSGMGTTGQARHDARRARCVPDRQPSGYPAVTSGQPGDRADLPSSRS